MKEKINDIIEKVSNIRAFNNDSYLTTTHFAIFLLFGCSEEVKQALEHRAKEIIKDKNAIAFISADASLDIVAEVRAKRAEVAQSGVNLENLRHVHFNMLIFSDAAQPEQMVHVVNEIEASKGNGFTSLWKPFIILNPEEPSADRWLETIAAMIRRFAASGASTVTRCCVMTRHNEIGVYVPEDRLVNNVLFIAMLHANSRTEGAIGNRIAYFKDSDPDDLFYTAQTVFISNPATMRTLNCMKGLLQTVDQENNEPTELYMGFVNDILQPMFSRLPQESPNFGMGEIIVSFAPVLGVMPSPQGDNNEFSQRLLEFANTHYLSQFEINKDKIFAEFRRGFLQSFIASGLPVDYLQSIRNNPAERQRLARYVAVCQFSLPPMVGGKNGLSKEHAHVLNGFIPWLRTTINNIGNQLLEEFYDSSSFESLPRLYEDARRRIKDSITSLEEEVSRRRNQGREIILDLIENPDDKLVQEAAKNNSAQSAFSECISRMTLALEAGDENAAAEGLNSLVDVVYNEVGRLAGSDGARAYMKLLSDTCYNFNSNLAKEIVTKIAGQLRFPIFVNHAGKKQYTFIWGSDENHFYNAWKQLQNLVNTDTEFLSIGSKERFVLMTVSPAFTREAIKEVQKEVKKEEAPQPMAETMPPPIPIIEAIPEATPTQELPPQQDEIGWDDDIINANDDSFDNNDFDW